jgi:hypothetical protein
MDRWMGHEGCEGSDWSDSGSSEREVMGKDEMGWVC